MSRPADSAADIGLPKTTRRSVLKAFQIAGAGAALPVSALAHPPESDTLRLFRRWDAIMARFYSETDPDLGDDLLVDSFAQIEAMLALPSQTAEDFALKLVAACNWGDLGSLVGPSGEAILQDAKTVVTSRDPALRYRFDPDQAPFEA